MEKLLVWVVNFSVDLIYALNSDFRTSDSFGLVIPSEDNTGTLDDVTTSVENLTDEMFLKHDFRGKSIDFEDSHYDTDSGSSTADSSYSRFCSMIIWKCKIIPYNLFNCGYVK